MKFTFSQIYSLYQLDPTGCNVGFLLTSYIVSIYIAFFPHSFYGLDSNISF